MPLFSDADRLRFVNDGQRVTLGLSGGRGLACVVLKAAGDSAYVGPVNPDSEYVPRWVDVYDLFPEVTPELRAARGK